MRTGRPSLIVAEGEPLMSVSSLIDEGATNEPSSEPLTICSMRAIRTETMIAAS